MNATTIKLSPAVEKHVRSAREALNTALAAYDTITAAGEELSEKAESLAATIAELEARLNPLDDSADSACLKIAGHRTRLTALEKKLSTLNSEIEEAEQNVFALYGEAQRIVGEAHRLEYAQTRDQANQSIAPYYAADSPLLLGVVEQFPLVRQLNWFVGNAGVSDTPSIEQARKLLAILEDVLVGKSGFIFTPE